MHVSIPVRAMSHQPAEPEGDPGDGLSPSSWVSPPPVTPMAPAPMAPVAPVAGEARELTKRKDREDREELKAEVTKDESLRSKSDTSSKNRVLVSLEISDDELDGDETYCLLLRKLSSYKLTWVLVTALTVLVCSALANPVLCTQSPACEQHHLLDQDLSFYSGGVSAALASVLMHELASVMLTHRTAKKAIDIIPDIKDSLIPSMLLCATFFVLIIENMTLVLGELPWYAHAANLGKGELDDTPVYSVFYAEWLINVPILLVFAGSIALGRPGSEVAEPLLITNVYIVFAWVANFISNPALRYAVVSISFLMYFRASWTMCQWVYRWRQRNPKGFLLGRPLLAFVLIIVFGIYGIVYLARMHGLVSYRHERIFYVTMNFTTKLFASMTLAGIRSSDFQELLLTMLVNRRTSFTRKHDYGDTVTPLLDK